VGTLEVIGAGFGRTGTLSLKLALERLGFGPCYHMLEIVEQPWRARDWAAAARGEPIDWDRVFAGYRATVDWPGAAFWRDLVDRYPDAKVILTVRDPARWYESAQRTIFRAMISRGGPASRLIRSLAMSRGAPSREFVEANQRLIGEGTFGGRVADRDHAMAVFETHNREVKDRVPAGRLLVMEIGSGWEPLCAFLGVPVPDEPFPHVNDGDEFQRRIRRRIVRGLALRGAVVGTLLAAAAAAGVVRAVLNRDRQRA